jgi:hypothetical protein
VSAAPATQAFVTEASTRLAAAAVPAGVAPAEARALRQAVDQSFTAGFRLAMVVAAGLALAGAASSAVLIEARTGAGR